MPSPFVSSSADGYFAKADNSLATALDATTADSIQTGVDNLLGLVYFGGVQYNVYRSVTFYDTSSIPDTATVTDVTLTLTCKQLAGTGEVTHVVTTTNTAPLGTSSYNKANFGSSALGSFTATPSADTGYTVTLTGLTINLTGTTAVGLRGKDDIDRNADTGVNFARWYSADATTESYRPTLTIEYTAGGTSVPVWLLKHRSIGLDL